jgi:O-antigen/teichoic acid export membrane protein
MRNTVSHLARMPKKLFLIDGFGALLTTFLLFIVWRNFNEHIGIPKTTLTYLAAIAACICLYAIVCFLCLKQNWEPFIRLMSWVNIFYCLLTLVILIIYCSQITLLGIAYFFFEIVIIIGLVYIELSVANEIKNKQ